MHWLTNNWKSDLHRLVLGGAWFFAIFSLVPLLWLGLGVNGDGSDRVFGTELNGVSHSVWGLTYAGIPGAILMWVEFLAVMGAIAATAVPKKWVPLKWRRIGHGVLIGWAGLWTAGVMHLAGVNPGFFALQAVFLAALLGCTIYRARLEWSDANGSTTAPKGPPSIDPFDLNPPDQDHTSPPTDVAAEEKLMLALRDVQAPRTLREVPPAAKPTTPVERLKHLLRQTFDRDAMRHAARRAAQFTIETGRASASVGRAIGRRFVAAAKAWKSYDVEETSPRV